MKREKQELKLKFRVTFLIIALLYMLEAKNIKLSENLYAQESSKPAESKLTLQTLGITPFPELDDLKDVILPEGLKVTQTISPVDINTSFTNLDDLKWLEPIAQNHKVFLLGESHWSRTIGNLSNRVLFALNTFDYYPLILLESQFSLSGFLNHYVGILDDTEAKDFYDKVLSDIGCEGRYLKHIRRWNKTHPSKQIHVGAYDIEWNAENFARIVLPYFKKLDSAFNIDEKRTRERQYIEEQFKHMEKLLQVARGKKLKGDYDFLTPAYMECILENAKSTVNAMYEIGGSLSYHRSQAMIRNLTDPRFFGSFFENGKVMIRAGSAHTMTHLPHKQGDDFYREGSYLSFDYEPTKGRTYSLAAMAFAYSIGSMSEADLNSFPYLASDYRDMIKRFQRAYRQKLVYPEKYYLFNNELKEFRKFVFKMAYAYDHQPMLVENIPWDINENFVKRAIDDDLYGHDGYILIPRTKISTTQSED